MKRCPYCAEPIQDDAIKCRYCGEMLSSAAAAPPSPTKHREPSGGRRAPFRALMAVAVVVVGAGIAIGLRLQGGSEGSRPIADVEETHTLWTELVSGESGVACGISQGTTWCWGPDEYGLRGDGSVGGGGRQPMQVALPDGVELVQISFGSQHACATAADGSAWCWGTDDIGQLGNGSVVGQQDSPSKVEAPSGVRFQQVSAGSFHTCALDEDGGAWCWGRGSSGELGDGSLTGSQLTPSAVEMPDDTSFIQISASYNFTCALSSEGSIWCWGDGYWGGRGQYGEGQFRNAPARIPSPEGRTISAIANGPFHLCALANDGSIWCWGLGFDDSREEGNAWDTEGGSASMLALPSGSTAIDLSSTGAGTCVVTKAGEAPCWVFVPDSFPRTISSMALSVPDGVSLASVSFGGTTCGIAVDGIGWCWSDGPSRLPTEVKLEDPAGGSG